MAQMEKNPSVMQETWVRSLGQDNALEKGMATHFSVLAWRIPMDRGACQVQSIRVTQLETTEATGNETVSHLFLLLNFLNFFQNEAVL